MLSALFHLVYFTFFFITSSCFFLVACLIKLLTFPFDRRLVLLHRFACLWASFYLWTMPLWQVKISGREKIRHDATYVVVSNHQSMMDILLGYRLFFHFKWVAKAELFLVPFIGWNMLLNKYVFVKRGDRKSIVEMMRASEAHLRKGSSVYIYPEGTRSETGKVNKFKSGAFSLAKRVGVPILPIAITGSKDTLPKGKFKIEARRHVMEVAVLDEVPAEVVAESDPRALAEEVRARIIAFVERNTLAEDAAAGNQMLGNNDPIEAVKTEE